MSTIVYIACIAFIFFLIRRMRKARAHGNLTPQNDAQRMFQFDQRIDAAIGRKSEEYEAKLARGIRAKRRMLAQIRNIEARKAAASADPRIVIKARPRLTLSRSGAPQ